MIRFKFGGNWVVYGNFFDIELFIKKDGNVAATMVASAKMLVRAVLIVVFLAYLCGAKKEKAKEKQSGTSYELNEEFARILF